MKRKEKERKNKYGEVKQIIHVEVKGKRFVAIGDQLYFSDKWRTFPDFLYDYLMNVFGEEWFDAEKSKSREDMHPVMGWRHDITDFQNSQNPNEDGIFESIPSGPFKAFITLAYDLYLMVHHSVLHDSFISRLRNKDQFQGTRYEIFVAATLIRLGYDVERDAELVEGKRNVEFLATDKESGEIIAIEAKSRHRPGILGRPGKPQAAKTVRVRLGQLLNDAIAKKPQYPYLIFIDLNLPVERMDVFNNDPKVRELVKSLRTPPKSSSGQDCFNAIFYTNFPYHYGDKLDKYPEDHLSLAYSQNPQYPLKGNVLKRVAKAINQYGVIPNDFP